MKKMNNGSISIFALLSMMFFLIFIMVAYNNVMQKGKTQVETEGVLVEYYKTTQNAEEIKSSIDSGSVNLGLLKESSQRGEILKSTSNNQYIYSNSNVYKILEATKEYQEVEYIQSNGNQYINTGLIGHMNYKYEIEFQQLDSSSYRIWGAFGQNNYVGYNMSITWISSSRGICWESQASNQNYVSIGELDSNKHTIIIDDGYIIYDGVNKGRSSGHNSEFSIDKNIFLFTANPGDATPTSNLNGRIFSYKVWDNNGNIVQDFIPCYKIPESDNIIGMYDIVNNEFYTNAGTGSFTKGPDI